MSNEGNETSKSVTLLTDRSSGASSITDDSMEVMIHRRLLGTSMWKKPVVNENKSMHLFEKKKSKSPVKRN